MKTAVLISQPRGAVVLLVVIGSALLFSAVAHADTYRVGPDEEFTKVSEVAGKLKASDVVEITGDIVDTVTLTAHGTHDNPIIIRGVTHIDNGRIIRPKIVGTGVQPGGDVIACKADWNIIEGLDVQVDPDGLVEGSACIRVAGDNDVVRNCHMSLSWLGVATDWESSGDVLIEFCDFDSLYRPLGLNYRAIAGRRPAVATVQHCYIHDCTGGYTMLRSEYARSVIRYNWFENASNKAMSIVGPSWPEGQKDPQAEHAWPAHADIVGNVFFHGVSPDGTHAILTLGGEDEENPGPEGDFNIAHNLFVRTENGWDAELSSHILMLPNVDNVRLYNNVFLDYASRASSVYNTVWAAGTPGYHSTPEFAARHEGNVIAPTVGLNNWVSEDAGGIPDTLENTLRGPNPKMVSLLDQDYRPRLGSPLVQAGVKDLPMGRIIALVPEYEPQRGIPTDLQPKTRPQVNPPSSGPFEAAVSAEYIEGMDEATEMVLGLRKAGARFPWELEFGQARQKALQYLAQGDKDKALACAKMQFILSPPDAQAMRAAIDSVKEMLEALDGDTVRTEVFELYATHGPDGVDGEPGTEDDLENPLAGVPLTTFAKDEAYYRDIDAAIDGRIAFSSEGKAKAGFYENEKAFARINGAAFDEAVAILIETLESLVTLDDKGRQGYDGHADFSRVQYQIDGIRLGLSAYYKATAGTTKGMKEFVAACINYCACGPMGKDRKLGTADDLKPPL